MPLDAHSFWLCALLDTGALDSTSALIVIDTESLDEGVDSVEVEVYFPSVV